MPLEMTVPERCLLYLLDRVDVTKDHPAVEQLTQDQISESIGVSRPHVSRALGRMERREEVRSDKVRPRGTGRRKLAYFLTGRGLKRARDVRLRLEEEEVLATDVKGDEQKLRLYKVFSLLPRKSKFLNLLLSVEDGRVDMRRLLDPHGRLRGSKVFDVHEAITVPHFSGRKDMLSSLDAFVEAQKVRGFLLVGLPGIGKTALASKWVVRMEGRMHVLWRCMRKETTARDILRDLADILRFAGRPALSEFLQRPPEDGKNAYADLLKRDLSGLSVLLVLDNAQMAGDEVAQLIIELLNMDQKEMGMKVLLLARERVSFCRAEDMAKGRIRVQELDDLSRPEVVAMLSALKVEKGRHSMIWKACGGHPLALELAAEGAASLDDVRRTSSSRLAHEVMAKISPKIRDDLAFAAVFESSIPVSLLGAHGQELLRLCLLRNAGDRRASVHDLVREAALQNMAPDQLAALHKRAGEFLARSRDIRDAIEAVRHFTSAGAFHEAEALVLERGQEYVDAGLADGLLTVLDQLLWTSKDSPLAQRILLLRAHALFALGRWGEAARAYDRCSAAEDRRVLAEALLGQGKAEVQLHSPLAITHLRKARELLERLGASRLLAEAYYWIGGSHDEAERLKEARSAYERGRAVAFNMGDRRWEGLCTYGIGSVLSLKKDYSGAAREDKEALRLLEREGCRLEIAKVCTGLGGELLELGKYEESEGYLVRAIGEARSTGAVGILAHALYNLASSRDESGRMEDSIALFEEALGLFEAQGKYHEGALCSMWLASYAWAKGQEEAGNEHAHHASRLLSKTTEPALRARTLRSFARAALEVSRKGIARKYLKQAIAEAKKGRLAGLRSELEAELDGIR